MEKNIILHEDLMDPNLCHACVHARFSGLPHQGLVFRQTIIGTRGRLLGTQAAGLGRGSTLWS